jgi:hypothetical protein
LDISENGIRSFLIYDTSSDKVIRQPIQTSVIYFQETITVLPVEDEAKSLREDLEKRISQWGLDEEQKKAVKARILVQGYAFDRELVSKTITEVMTHRNISLISPPDLRQVKISDDVMQADIVHSVQGHFRALDLPDDKDEPTVDDYILSAMNQVYGG